MPKGHRQDDDFRFASRFAVVVDDFWSNNIAKPGQRAFAGVMGMARNTFARRMHEIGITWGSSGLSREEIRALAQPSSKVEPQGLSAEEHET